MLVCKRQGVIKDFPGNYTQFRQWSALQPKEVKDNKSTKDRKDSQDQQERKSPETTVRRKLSYKEKREMEQLEKDIERLETEKADIEEQLCSGTLSVDELTEKSKRLPLLGDELDEKSMRWLELSEIEG